jgi:hypothetical protein
VGYVWATVFLLGASMAAAGAPSNLAITELTLRESEDGQPAARAHFGAGQSVYLSFRVAGFAARGEDREVELTWTIDALDPAKRPIAQTVTGNLKVELAPEDKDWMPKVRYNVQVPPVPEPGTYTIAIVVEDKVAGKSTRTEQQFRVEGAAVPEAAALGVSNFRFQRTENDAAGMPEPATYRPGDVVWARFDVSGYKFGPRNKYDVRYGLALKDPNGKIVFTQPQAAADSDEGFYPKRFVSATFSVTLNKKVAAGEYTLAVTLSDGIGNQTAESAHTFRVESEK